MQKDRKEQFLQIYKEYFPRIYNYCLFRVSLKEDAEDITEMTFIKTWDYLSEGKHIDNFKAFLFRVAHNLTINLYGKRTQDKEHIVSLTSSITGKQIDIPDDTDIHDDLETKELYKSIRQELAQLKPEYRDVMLLRYVDDMSLSDIAQTLQISETNVRVRLHRATRKMKDVFVTEV
jgi:RNA polymerase sigma-70 factor, ECF subfamily